MAEYIDGIETQTGPKKINYATTAQRYDEPIITAGTGAAYTATVPWITTLKAGISFVMIPHVVSSSGTATLNVNGLGAKALKMYNSTNSSGVGNLPIASALSANIPIRVLYNGTYWILEESIPSWHTVSSQYEATITTTWTGTSAPFSQDITITGISSGHKPIVDIVPSDTFTTAQTQLEEWNKIYRITTASNKITVYATEKTTTAIPIQLIVVSTSVLS